ncbi:thaumatin [Artemisia annua]|uniref:Thaumatin n=1 Tax=Artemisia annua TaxID=35608 RepID=A0A2U1N1E5_ARTAN|nr:thaumatin [Artemisia annua]
MNCRIITTIGGYNNLDYYDVSFVDVYNLPIIVVPWSTASRSNAMGCVSDLNMGCPKELIRWLVRTVDQELQAE